MKSVCTVDFAMWRLTMQGAIVWAALVVHALNSQDPSVRRSLIAPNAVKYTKSLARDGVIALRLA